MTRSATLTAHHAPADAPDFADDYASLDHADAQIAAGQVWRTVRLAAPDMLSSDAAAKLIDTQRETINQWIAAGRCIGLERPVRGWRLPRWQFQPQVLKHLAAVSQALGTSDGWAMLLFLETPHPALDGRAPRQALEQGQAARVIELAATHATSDQ
jgi:hypothetical protein